MVSGFLVSIRRYCNNLLWVLGNFFGQ